MNRGMTLIELVVAISILGVIGSVAVFIVSLLASTYRDSRFQSMESMQMKTALQQICHELSAAYPPSVEIGNSTIRLQQVFTAGIADTLENGGLTDIGNPVLSQVQKGMKIAIDSFTDTPDYFEVKNVNGNQFHLQSQGMTPDRSRRYWILNRSLRYALEEGALRQYQENYGSGEPGLNGYTLCDSVSGFAAHRIGGKIILELEMSDELTQTTYRETQSVSLN